MKKIIGVILMIAGIGNMIQALGGASTGNSPDNVGGKFLFSLLFLGIGIWMFMSSKKHKSEEFTASKPDTLIKPDIQKASSKIQEQGNEIQQEQQQENNVGFVFKENLIKRLMPKYVAQFGKSLDERHITLLAEKVATVSKSFSDTTISIMMVDNAINRQSFSADVIKTNLLSISENYSKNTMKNLAAIGEILGKQIIEIPHLTSTDKNIPMDQIYRQGYELIALGERYGIEGKITSILAEN